MKQLASLVTFANILLMALRLLFLRLCIATVFLALLCFVEAHIFGWESIAQWVDAFPLLHVLNGILTYIASRTTYHVILNT